MIVELVKTNLEDAIRAAIGAVDKGYKLVTAVEKAGLIYLTLDASDIVKAVEALTPEAVAAEPQEVVKPAEVVAEKPQAVEVEVAKPTAKKGRK
jgi:hypothetical protein